MSESRNMLRAKLLGKQQRKSKTIMFFGEEIEVRQPPIGEVLDINSEEGRKKNLIRALIMYCYVPGTDEKIFEEADEEVLLQHPAGEDLTRFNAAIEELTNIDIGDARKN